MLDRNQMTKIALATAAAALFTTMAAGCSMDANKPAAQQAMGKCIGGNACKGQSSCASANSSCAGQNSCKGQGWVPSTKADCTGEGTHWEASA